ncbi:hypothetical protein ACGFSB_18315 [Streptomyces sp. NPDC048441]|uniref:hypothetical protein n=1 Tax=Streptomyces sp. NPDC048441 TaxID=3365552 RepID=UPI00371F54A1
METTFKASFMLAVAAEIVLVAVLVFQVWRRERHGSTAPLVFTGDDALAGASLFGGAMTLTVVLSDGWGGMSTTDILLYAATFGIVTAGFAKFLRGADKGRPEYGRIAFLLPLGFGVLAGLSGV